MIAHIHASAWMCDGLATLSGQCISLSDNLAQSMIFAVMPLKPFTLAKSRLAPVLGLPQRSALAKAMAADVLAALNAVPDVSRILIVSNEPEISQLTKGVNVICLRDSELTAAPGLNAVVTGAARYLADANAEAMLAVPGDLPCLSPGDIARFIDSWRALPDRRRVALAPAHDGGTNLLLAGPPGAIAFSYGSGSLTAHAQAARHGGCGLAVIELQGAARDIDEMGDLEALAEDARLGQRTRALLQSGAMGDGLRQRPLARGAT